MFTVVFPAVFPGTVYTLQTLVEVAQRFLDGRRRERNLPLSEKLKPSEAPCIAAERGIREELSSYILPDTQIMVELDPDHPHCSNSKSVSKSYPGFLSEVRSWVEQHQTDMICTFTTAACKLWPSSACCTQEWDDPTNVAAELGPVNVHAS